MKHNLIINVVLIVLMSVMVFATIQFITPPTPTLGDSILTSYINVEVQANITGLKDFRWEWEGTNYTIYNSSLILMYNFDNISALGENNTRIVDMSLYQKYNAT
ncbi:MAG: hypothetical protein KKC80_08690, partial [Candidatus Margulisbacteria bacterium]|nr:hypothetical protein [Candidatus Margulisiibacteriota bacterium]